MIILTWVEITNSILLLSKVLKGRKVYGIPRGGTLIATLLSYRGCELMRDPLKSPFKNAPEEGVVIVDDIADTGETLNAFAMVGYQTAALFVRRGCEPLPDFHTYFIDEKDYVAFPYEDLTEAATLEAKGEYRTHG